MLSSVTYAAVIGLLERMGRYFFRSVAYEREKENCLIVVDAVILLIITMPKATHRTVRRRALSSASSKSGASAASAATRVSVDAMAGRPPRKQVSARLEWATYTMVYEQQHDGSGDQSIFVRVINTATPAFAADAADQQQAQPQPRSNTVMVRHDKDGVSFDVSSKKVDEEIVIISVQGTE